MAKSNKTYEVGYKKPPKATRFPKGTSANPGGKPKKVPPEFDLGKILQSVDNEEIIIPVDGKRKRMTRAEIRLRQLFTQGIKGDLTASRLLVKIACEHSQPGDSGKYSLECIGETEAVKRFGRNWKRKIEKLNAIAGGCK
jgi:uncharacterized protein DUF5681